MHNFTRYSNSAEEMDLRFQTQNIDSIYTCTSSVLQCFHLFKSRCKTMLWSLLQKCRVYTGREILRSFKTEPLSVIQTMTTQSFSLSVFYRSGFLVLILCLFLTFCMPARRLVDERQENSEKNSRVVRDHTPYVWDHTPYVCHELQSGRH